MFTRREFLAGSSGSLIAAALGPHPLAAAERPWYATMRRCGQLNLNERDPQTLDVKSWIDYWASLKLDALLLNGGGIVASMCVSTYSGRYEVGQLTEKFLQPLLKASEKLERLL